MLSGNEVFGLMVIAGAVIVVTQLILEHRLSMAKARNGQGSSVDHSAELEALRERCVNLEKRCDELQLQVTDAHSQLTDERRDLDRRLASVLPDEAPQDTQQRKPFAAKTVM